jgi:hypothetical protein
VAIQRLYRCARPNLRGSSSICRQSSPTDQRLERKRDSDDKCDWTGLVLAKRNVCAPKSGHQLFAAPAPCKNVLVY